jgi:hypothetical protein
VPRKLTWDFFRSLLDRIGVDQYGLRAPALATRRQCCRWSPSAKSADANPDDQQYVLARIIDKVREPVVPISPSQPRQFAVTIAVRSWWLCGLRKAEPVEEHKESGVILDLTRFG